MIQSILSKISKKPDVLLKFTQSKFGIQLYNSKFTKLLFKYLQFNTIVLVFFVWAIGS
jgi:hypothetical protein